MAKKKRRTYTPEFRAEAVALVVDGGVSQAQVARDLAGPRDGADPPHGPRRPVREQELPGVAVRAGDSCLDEPQG
jgi:hypothetical protein